jgi:Fe-S-cluster containining protein
MNVTLDYCKNCGVCCFFGKATAGKKWLGIEIGDDGWCKFYDPEKKCTIHDKKPQVCKDFKPGCPECIDMCEQALQKKINSK